MLRNLDFILQVKKNPWRGVIFREIILIYQKEITITVMQKRDEEALPHRNKEAIWEMLREYIIQDMIADWMQKMQKMTWVYGGSFNKSGTTWGKKIEDE